MTWFLALTKPRQEEVAQIELERQNYRTYLPMIRVDKRLMKRCEVECMFPRYVFFQATIGETDFAPIKSTRGVAGIVRFGLWPAPVPSVLVEQLKLRESAGGVHEPLKFAYELGDPVRINAGVFQGYNGVIAAAKNDRIYVFLNDVSIVNKLELSIRDIEPITA